MEDEKLLDQRQIWATARAAEALQRIIRTTVHPQQYAEVQAAVVEAAGRIVAAMVAARVI